MNGLTTLTLSTAYGTTTKGSEVLRFVSFLMSYTITDRGVVSRQDFKSKTELRHGKDHDCYGRY